MNTTKIEWATEVWNPVTGCTKVSQGCKHCYAERLAPRVFAGQTVEVEVGTAKGGFSRPRMFTDVQCHPDRLEQPLHKWKPRKIFVNSMSDLFHEQVPVDFINKVFAVMALCPQHTFQVLTKRPERMAEYIPPMQDAIVGVGTNPTIWPLPNVWLGVSVENRETLHRVDDLRATPAAVRFLSLEPLLEDLGQLDLTGIHWVIVGGESGPGARPMHPNWVRSIQDQCITAVVPFFFKQWGAWVTEAGIGPDGPPQVKVTPAWLREDGDVCEGILPPSPDVPSRHSWMKCARVGKKAAGRLLDGWLWEEMPS